MLGQAVQAHRAGRLAEAKRLFGLVLSEAPENVCVLHAMGTIALQTGKPTVAERFLRRALTLERNNPEILANLGAALLMLGHPQEAVAALRQTLMHHPAHPTANYNLGLMHLQAGRFDEAASHLGTVVAAQPGNANALNALGVALIKLEKAEAAIPRFREALAVMPGKRDFEHNLANALGEAKSFVEAFGLYETLLDADPRNARLRFDYAHALAKAGRVSRASEEYTRVIALEPKNADAHNNLGNLLKVRGRLGDAEYHLRQAAALRPDDPNILNNLAGALDESGKGVDAREICRKALTLHPDDFHSRSIMVRSFLNDGLFDEAMATIQEMPNTGAGALQRCFLMANNHSYRFTDDDIRVLESALEEPSLTSPLRADVCFTLGRALHNRGDHAKAFRFYQDGNCLLDVNGEAGWIDRRLNLAKRARVFTADVFQRFAGLGTPSEKPIFIVGMPRSGTTLLEQILASHPDVVGGGELPDIEDFAHGLAEKHGTEDYLNCIANLDESTIGAATEQYLSRLDAISPSALRVTNKMPANFLHLGLIAVLFPGARIIHCTRDPRATCLSIFFHKFLGYHPYAYNLQKLGRYYRLYTRLMEHWRKVLPLAIHEVRYEDLVADPERVSRDLLEHCGLAWDVRVLRFHETRRSVQTASLWQVRQPLYRDSVDSWRRYEADLAPLLEALQSDDPMPQSYP